MKINAVKYIALLIFIFMLLFLMTGCGKEDDASEEKDIHAETAYFEALAAGQQRCPMFPEVDYLAQVDEQFLLDSICPAIVRLESGDLFGSGVIWKMEEESIWILTNQHMIDQAQEDIMEENQTVLPIDVIFWDGIRTYGEIIKTSERFDLGILRVNLKEMGYHTVERYFSVRYDEDFFENLNPGEDLFIVGSADYPAGNLYYGTIGNRSIYMNTFGEEMLWAYCEVKPGMSGSGVFDRKGNLIGIVCAGNEKNEAAVLPIDKILLEWEEQGY